MYERFTDRSQRVMQFANQEAQRLNHSLVGTEHVLLGLVKECHGVASTVLQNLGIDLRMIRLEVEKLVQYGTDACLMGKLPLHQQTRQTVEYAIEEARSLNHNYVGTEHLLLGLLLVQDSIACKVIASLGLTAETVRRETLNLIGFDSDPRRNTATASQVGVVTTELQETSTALPVFRVKVKIGGVSISAECDTYEQVQELLDKMTTLANKYAED